MIFFLLINNYVKCLSNITIKYILDMITVRNLNYQPFLLFYSLIDFTIKND